MKNIIENNKLIAEFMGFVQDKSFKVKLADGVNTSYYYYKGDDMYLPETMLYSCSWDWIMPVVEKIEQSQNIVGFTIFGDSRNYYQVTIKQYQKTGRITISNVEGKSKIEAVYVAVVEFIKWHNSKK